MSDRQSILKDIAGDIHILLLEAIEHGIAEERLRRARSALDARCDKLSLRIGTLLKDEAEEKK